MAVVTINAVHPTIVQMVVVIDGVRFDQGQSQFSNPGNQGGGGGYQPRGGGYMGGSRGGQSYAGTTAAMRSGGDDYSGGRGGGYGQLVID